MEQSVMEVIKTAQLKLERAGIEMARLEAEMIAAYTLGCERHHLYLNRNLLMDSKQIKDYFDLIERRQLGKPIQYIIGYKEFMGLDFKVDHSVLIPRCDTEVLVESVIDRLPSDREILVADIGTGSGAIAVSLAHFMSNLRVIAVDIDKKALDIAKTNAKAHGVEENISFLKGNLFDALEDKFEDAFDAIISNPPYIPSHEIDKLSKDVREFEPRLALDGGDDGLDFYRKIANQGHSFIKDKGFIALEVGYNQAPLVSNILQRTGIYEDISYIEDLSGIERVVIARISKSRKGVDDL